MDVSAQRFRRYVAIGDSSTEGLEDPYADGGYRGWADRLAEHLAANQSEPLEYANLAVRGLTVAEIRRTQFDQALELEPDLMTIFGGVNDMLGPRPDVASIAADYEGMFAETARRGITVVTFTMIDPAAINPFATLLRERMRQLNRIIRETAGRHGVGLVDFEQYPVAADPRLWFEDRLHGSPDGHARIAAALAARLGVEGFGAEWQQPLPEQYVRARGRARVRSDLRWTRSYFTPWLIRAVRRVPHGSGVTAKRPVPTVVQVNAP